MTLTTQIRTALAELELISHAPTKNFDPSPRDTSEEPSGRRPPGGDRDRPPRNATTEERDAWRDSYQAKTVEHFRRELEVTIAKAATASDDATDFLNRRLNAILTEIKETTEAWKKAPMGDGQEPLSRADPRWKRYIAWSDRDTGDLARQYGVTRRYIQKIRALDWSAREAA